MRRNLKTLWLGFSVTLICLFAQSAPAQTPKTVRDFFNLLPSKYFTLEGCEPARDKGCVRARREYLERFTEVEDIANGYFKGGCDGAQSCIEMALFKRPDGTYIVGLATSHEMMNDYRFLEYKSGKWTDVSLKIVPRFSRKNMYALPRYGTTVGVFAKKIIESGSKPGEEYEISEKGGKLYDLVWQNGKFVVRN